MTTVFLQYPSLIVRKPGHFTNSTGVVVSKRFGINSFLLVFDININRIIDSNVIYPSNLIALI